MMQQFLILDTASLWGILKNVFNEDSIIIEEIGWSQMSCLINDSELLSQNHNNGYILVDL